MSLKIYIAAHKPYPKLTKYIDDAYQFIQPGQKGKKPIEGYISDDFIGSISDKNPYYSELTALYAIWKNLKSDYVGLVHYRRIFSNKKITLFKYQGLKKEKALKILKNYDMILPLKTYLRKTNYKNYEENHYIDDLLKVEAIIKNLYPDYLDAYYTFLNQKEAYYYNMFVMKWDLYDQYMKFMFDILFELEKAVNIENYDDYQKRIFGFISERLFNIWLIKNQPRVKEMDVILIEKNPFVVTMKRFLSRIFGASGKVK
jgi:hypothetical protein